MRLSLSTFLIILILAACSDSATSDKDQTLKEQNQSYSDSLTQVLDALYQKGHFKGFSVAIADDQGTFYTKGFGYANVEQQKAYTDQTVQNIASISKTFIGIGLLKAQELGYLKLDDPVNQYLPFEVLNPYFPTEPITIRQLTNHTSSIIDSDSYDQSYVLKDPQPDTTVYEVDEDFNQPTDKTSMGVFLEKVLSAKGEWYEKEGFLEKRPGEQFDYSNVAATLAAYVIERAAKEPFDAFTRKHILEPLNMSQSGWSFEKIDMEQHTTLYGSSNKPIPPYSLITYPDGGMRTSASDMAKYLTELIKAKKGKGTLLSPESYKTYFQGSLDDAQFEDGRSEASNHNDEYDMGVFMGMNGLGSYTHSGGDPGTASLLFFTPETSYGRYLIINTDISSQEGVDTFYGIINTLAAFEGKFQR